LTARRWRPDLEVVLPVPDDVDVDVLRDELAPGPSPGGPSILFDVYRPATPGPPRPIVLFVHGDATPEVLAHAKDWGQFTSWARLVASRDMVGVTFSHSSLLARTQMDLVIAEITAVVDAVRSRAAELGGDDERVAITAISACAPFGLTVAYAALPAIRCAVAGYGPLLPENDPDYTEASVTPADLERCSPLWLLEALGPNISPTLILKAGLDRAPVNDGIDAFVARASELGAPVEVILHETGHHAFDVLDDDDRSREIIEVTLGFLARHLAAVTA
jgi:dienelactone hydrolase